MSGCWLQEQEYHTRQSQQQHQRSNNLQPMSGCWLQEQEHHMRQRDSEARTNERLLMMEKKRKQAWGCKPEKHNSSNHLQPMSGCWLQALCLWLQAREAQQQQQPTTNERLMAARARAPHEAERQRGAHQRAVVNDGKKEKASLWLQTREAQQQQQPTTNERLLAASQQHQRGNNLQPSSGCWLQEQEHHTRQRDIEAPMSGC